MGTCELLAYAPAGGAMIVRDGTGTWLVRDTSTRSVTDAEVESAIASLNFAPSGESFETWAALSERMTEIAQAYYDAHDWPGVAGWPESMFAAMAERMGQ